MVYNLDCFRFMVETLNIDQDKVDITLLYDDRKECKVCEVTKIAEGLKNQPTLISGKRIIQLAQAKMNFKEPGIIQEMGPIIKPLFMCVMKELGYEKAFIIDEDIVILNDISHFWEHDYASKGARFLGNYPTYHPVCRRLFGLDVEGKHQNTGHMMFKYRDDYWQMFEKFFNSDEAITWYNERKKRKSNFFYGEQGFTSWYYSAYLPTQGIEHHPFKEKDVTIVFNCEHDEKIMKRSIVHYPVKKKIEKIEKIRRGIEMGKELAKEI
jgi:hypothetical protein